MLQADDNNLSLTYYLTSQIEARSTQDLADVDSKTSKLRTDATLYLYKPIDEDIEEVKTN